MILVTGCAGFIGSHIAGRLLSEGHHVTGVDSFNDYYPRAQKEGNMSSFRKDRKFRFIEGDLSKMDIKPLLKDAEFVFHDAAQAGVRGSWGGTFSGYVNNNIVATQRLLEACPGSGVKRFVFASSSSVYGDAETLPTREDAVPKPISPYGVTKLASENLCYAYFRSLGVPAVSLRYFSVYGPGQRPDMAFHKFIRAALSGDRISVYGDGSQTRDFTYVSDVVQANMLAMKKGRPGECYNIGGGSRVSVKETLGIIEKIADRRLSISFMPAEKGDARHTSADITKAREALGYRPAVGIEDGLRRQTDWLRGLVQ